MGRDTGRSLSVFLYRSNIYILRNGKGENKKERKPGRGTGLIYVINDDDHNSFSFSSTPYCSCSSSTSCGVWILCLASSSSSSSSSSFFFYTTAPRARLCFYNGRWSVESELSLSCTWDSVSLHLFPSLFSHWPSRSWPGSGVQY